MVFLWFSNGFLMVFCGVAVCLLFDAGFVGFPSTSQVPPFAPCQSLAEPPGSPQYMTALYGHMPPYLGNHLGVSRNGGWPMMTQFMAMWLWEEWWYGILGCPTSRLTEFQISRPWGSYAVSVWCNIRRTDCGAHVPFSPKEQAQKNKQRFSNSILQPCSCHSDVRSVAKLTTLCSSAGVD